MVPGAGIDEDGGPSFLVSLAALNAPARGVDASDEKGACCRFPQFEARAFASTRHTRPPHLPSKRRLDRPLPSLSLPFFLTRLSALDIIPLWFCHTCITVK